MPLPDVLTKQDLAKFKRSSTVRLICTLCLADALLFLLLTA